MFAAFHVILQSSNPESVPATKLDPTKIDLSPFCSGVFFVI
jgi:hypothetical protein